ncbi:MAG: right-handed parallel beta-helix repeat-containing protein [Ruminococcaceae bacterium]|nr:right-handed parallel beta-helix repeat-containing protein [Oscillospiraceae bacterium]
MKKFSTKKALVLSVLSLCLCLAMLLGTTFAWFTDEVTSSGNIIQTGTLKVGMYWVEGDEVVPAKGDAAWQDASKGAMFNNTLWEPGYVEAKHIMIANEGTLALDYKLRIVANGVVSKLSDVIDVYYFETAEQLTRDSAVTGTKLGTLTDILGTNKNLTKTVLGSLTAGETRTLTLALKMQETAGNEYQNLSIGADFSIQLIATQMASEEDSFDAYYDQFVTNPEMPAALVRPMTDLTIDTTGSKLGVDLGEFDLAAGYQFEPTADLANAMNSDYRLWHADFVVSADRDVLANTIVLAGYYNAWCSLNNDKWVALTADTDIAAGTEVRLVGSLPMNVTVNWEALCEYGNDGTGFLCGLAAADADALAKLAGTTVTVELRVYEVPAQGECANGGGCKHPHSECETGESFVLGTFKYTFPQPVSTTDELNELLAAGGDLGTIQLTNDLVGDVVVPQNSDANVIIDGNGHTIAGTILVDGKSATLTTAGLTIKNLTFKADSISADACIQLGQSGNNNTRYTCNVTVENCTFDVPGAVGVKSYTGGDKNLTIVNCTATENAHSLAQLKGVDGVLIKDCTVNSVRGINFNNSLNVVVENCTIDVEKYAVRFGESGNTIVENYEIIDCTIVSENGDGDAAIVLRAGATNANLTITNTTIDAGVEMSGHEDANVVIK